jgi:hypothetical protein
LIELSVYPLVSNNVGIDFTELGPPYGPKPGSAAQKEQGVANKKEDDLITIGFLGQTEGKGNHL